MTICVAVCVHDGIVFAADSATSLVGTDPQGQVVVNRVYKYGNKVFNLDKRCPIMAMTSGLGAIGSVPIHSIAKDFRRALREPAGHFAIDPDNYTVADVVDKAEKFIFTDRYAQHQPPLTAGLTFWIGGYSSGSETHELWRLEIAGTNCQKICEQQGETGGIFWSGQPDAIQRLVIGFDQTLLAGLVSAGVPPADIPNLSAHLQTHTMAPVWDLGMPVQDAIGLADFLAETTKNFVRFLPGADTVGGDTDIAVVTRHERFKWIRRKHYYLRELNQLETDHV